MGQQIIVMKSHKWSKASKVSWYWYSYSSLFLFPPTKSLVLIIKWSSGHLNLSGIEAIIAHDIRQKKKIKLEEKKNYNNHFKMNKRVI